MVDDSHFILGDFADGASAYLTPADRRRHLYVIGKTGTGKSTLLFNLMQADLNAGHGFALLDPHGDLAVAVADAVPSWRANDVIYLDPADVGFPIGFNPLANVALDRRSLVAAQVLSAFMHVWGGSLAEWPRLSYILTHGLRLLLDAPGATLLGLPRLLSDDVYRRSLLAHCRDPLVRAFWDIEFAGLPAREAAQAIMPVQNKIGTLLASPVLRNMLGQTRSTIDIRRIMDDGRVLIVNLAKGKLGATPTHLLGAFLATAFAQAAEARAELPEDERRDFTLIADEFQNFATDSFAGILSEARKYRLSLVLAHQFLGQLPDHLRQAVIGNVGSLTAFRIGAEDAPLLADELGIESRSALTDTANYSAWVKILRHGLPSDPRCIVTYPAEIGLHRQLQSIQARTRARYARPRAGVEAKIARFLSGATSGPRRPTRMAPSRAAVHQGESEGRLRKRRAERRPRGIWS